jgi:hypothetical protein
MTLLVPTPSDTTRPSPSEARGKLSGDFMWLLLSDPLECRTWFPLFPFLRSLSSES